MAEGCIIGLGIRKLTTVRLSLCTFGLHFIAPRPTERGRFTLNKYSSMRNGLFRPRTFSLPGQLLPNRLSFFSAHTVSPHPQRLHRQRTLSVPCCFLFSAGLRRLNRYRIEIPFHRLSAPCMRNSDKIIPALPHFPVYSAQAHTPTHRVPRVKGQTITYSVFLSSTIPNPAARYIRTA